MSIRASTGTRSTGGATAGRPRDGSETPHRTIAIHDESADPVSEPLSGLAPNTTYHVQLCARDGEESPPRTNCSKDETFSTLSAIGSSRIAFIRRRNRSDITHEPAGGGATVDSHDGALRVRAGLVRRCRQDRLPLGPWRQLGGLDDRADGAGKTRDHRPRLAEARLVARRIQDRLRHLPATPEHDEIYGMDADGSDHEADQRSGRLHDNPRGPLTAPRSPSSQGRDLMVDSDGGKTSAFPVAGAGRAGSSTVAQRHQDRVPTPCGTNTTESS